MMDKNLNVAITRVKMKTEEIIQWLTVVGMKVNKDKTELCPFAYIVLQPVTIKLYSKLVTSRHTIKVLGVTFDYKLNCFSNF